MLAGIPKAPSRFNPIANRPRAELRQRYVLGRMQSLGYLTEAEYKQAMAQPIVMKSAEGTPPAATPSTANTWPSWRASCCSTCTRTTSIRAA